MCNNTLSLVWTMAQDEEAKDKNQSPLAFLTENMEEESDAEDPTSLQHALHLIQNSKRAGIE